MVRKAKKKNSGIHIFMVLLIMSIIAAIACKSIITPVNQQKHDKGNDDKTLSNSSLKIISGYSDDRSTQVPLVQESETSATVSVDILRSPNAVLIRLKDHTVLMKKNSEEKTYPASLTKIMTTIVAIENLTDLKKKIKLTNSMFQGLRDADASMAGFQPGEQIAALDLLYGVMLPSGAECCIGLAHHISGSEEDFVKIMNEKAAELGLDNTHFENTTGLHDENHYTTVKDMAVLLSYALQNDSFREIFTSSRHSTQPTNKHPDGITFYSTMFKGLRDQSIISGEISGGKTGYTDEAGLCLASLAKVGSQEYVLVTAGARGNNRTEQFNITDAVAVYSSIGKQ